MPARLQPGQPPLRISELSAMSGYGVTYIRKAIKAGLVAHVVFPGTKEKRVPVDAAVKLLRDLRVF